MEGVIVKKVIPVHKDGRGEITDLLNERVQHVGLITSTKNSVRGNHYHKLSVQYTYVLSGKFEVFVAKVDDIKNIEKITLKAGEIITISPKIIHTFKAVEDSTMIDVISLSRGGDGYENDTIKGFALER